MTASGPSSPALSKRSKPDDVATWPPRPDCPLEKVPMEATGTTRKPGRCPWGLLGMIGIVAVVESYIAHHPAEFTDPSAYSWTLSQAAMRSEARSAEILCLGDSLVK